MTEDRSPYIGQTYTDELRDKIWDESGAATIRKIYPTTICTRDYRMDRLNIRLDENDVITGIGWG